MNAPSTIPVYFLLVDDLEENLLALEGLLRRTGLTLLKARSGAAALELLLKYDVALALIDVQMPGMDGFELAELMRGTRRTSRVPIIFLTAANFERQRRFRGYEAGAVDFLKKPIVADVLRSKADVFFELYQQRQEVALQRDSLQTAKEEISRLLAESRQFAAALQEADQRKDEFLAMLAHELRNPLAPIQNAVEILRLSESANEAGATAREIIARQVGHMSRLIEDLLDVARIVRRTMELRTETCQLDAIAASCVEDYQPIFAAAGVSLELDVHDRPSVQGDRVRLAQVIGNLLHNAAKFTPAEGRVVVRVGQDMSRQQALVEVQDNGLGLERAALDHLFEPFVQVNQTIDRAKGGLGLGLALVRGIIELHGGAVSVDSRGMNQGATFSIRLPANQNAVPGDSIAAPLLGKAPAGRSVLVIEDNRDSAQTLQMLLAHLGHQVQVAFDGDTGLALARSMRPDVILSDLGLPGGMDGFAVAMAVRKDQALVNSRLIALSGYGQEDDRQRARDAGFDAHLTKPITVAALSSALSER
jgi:signal transduction histidine kinase